MLFKSRHLLFGFCGRLKDLIVWWVMLDGRLFAQDERPTKLQTCAVRALML